MSDHSEEASVSGGSILRPKSLVRNIGISAVVVLVESGCAAGPTVIEARW
jgi:hypothetical protein